MMNCVHWLLPWKWGFLMDTYVIGVLHSPECYYSMSSVWVPNNKAVDELTTWLSVLSDYITMSPHQTIYIIIQVPEHTTLQTLIDHHVHHCTREVVSHPCVRVTQLHCDCLPPPGYHGVGVWGKGGGEGRGHGDYGSGSCSQCVHVRVCVFVAA